MSERLSQEAPDRSVLQGYQMLRETCGRVELRHERLIEMGGEDAKGWLQGQVTNDLRNFPLGATLGFCLCSATGQLEAIGQLWTLPGRIMVAMDEKAAPALLQRAEKMVVLEDVKARQLECDLISVQGPEATHELAKVVELPLMDAAEVEVAGIQVPCLRSNRSGFGGWTFVVGREHCAAAELLRKTFSEVDPEAYRIACLEAGTPRFGADTNSKTLPPELGNAFESSHISYKKGCYLGQEILMRMHSRGHTNRSWMGLLLEAPVREGDAVRHRDRDDAGVVTTAVESPEFGPIAGAFLRREACYSGEIVHVLTEEGPVEAEVQEMPLLRLG